MIQNVTELHSLSKLSKCISSGVFKCISSVTKLSYKPEVVKNVVVSEMIVHTPGKLFLNAENVKFGSVPRVPKKACIWHYACAPRTSTLTLSTFMCLRLQTKPLFKSNLLLSNIYLLMQKSALDNILSKFTWNIKHQTSLLKIINILWKLFT